MFLIKYGATPLIPCSMLLCCDVMLGGVLTTFLPVNSIEPENIFRLDLGEPTCGHDRRKIQRLKLSERAYEPLPSSAVGLCYC